MRLIVEQAIYEITRARDRPCFQTIRFPEFWQSSIPVKDDKKTTAKTLGSC